MKNRKDGIGRALPAVAAMIALVLYPGCIGAIAQMLYVIKGHKKPAEYSGLVGKKVAVVCVSEGTAYGPDILSYSINKTVSLLLKKSVKKINVIPPSNIEEWIDTNGWNQSNFVEIGKGLGADMVVAIDIGSYTIHEGQTLLKGRANLTVTVYDVAKGGQIAYVYGPTEYVFPKNGRPSIQSSERQFETVYLAKLTDHIARLFYDSDQLDQVADDASML